MTASPDTHQLGTVPDFKGERHPVERDFDALLTGPLRASGVRELEKLIAGYRTDLARWRAASLDLSTYGINLDECREVLATIYPDHAPPGMITKATRRPC